VPCGFTQPTPTPGDRSPSEDGPGAPKLADLPSIGGGLPIGLQLMGRRFDEATLLRVADAYERDTEWSKQPPPPIPNR